MESLTRKVTGAGSGFEGYFGRLADEPRLRS